VQELRGFSSACRGVGAFLFLAEAVLAQYPTPRRAAK
jgi:hypothetical protein